MAASAIRLGPAPVRLKLALILRQSAAGGGNTCSVDEARDLLLRRLEGDAAMSADHIGEAEPARAVRIGELDHDDVHRRHARTADGLRQLEGDQADLGRDGCALAATVMSVRP